MLKDLVKSPDAAEARCQGNLGHRQSRVVDQLLGQKYPPGLRDRDRRSAKMLAEQASKLAPANAQPRRQGLDVRLVERARFDQPERPGYGVGTAAPEGKIGRRFRPAAQARAKSGLLRRRGGGEEPDVFPLGRGAGQNGRQ